jgi:hypothetical protein
MSVDVFVSDQHVAIHLAGVDALAALRSRLILRTDDITSSRVMARDDALHLVSWRLGGTHVPGLVSAGRYAVRDAPGERAFLCVFRDEQVLCLTTALADPRFVILQHPDVHELAWLIGERVHR